VITAEGPESGRLAATEGGANVRYATTADPARFEAQFLEALNAQWP